MQMKRRFLEARDLYNTTGSENDKRTAAQLKKEYDLWLKHLRRQDHIDEVSKADNKSKALWRITNSERNSKEEQS